MSETALLKQAWNKLWDNELPAKVTEDPRFRAYRGYVGTRFSPPQIQSIRDDFEFAFSMKFDPPEEHVRAWYIAEEQFGETAHSCLKIINYIQQGRAYSAATKLSFLARKAGYYYNKGKSLRFDNVEEAKQNLQESLLVHNQVLKFAVDNGDLDVLKYEIYYRNTSLLLFNICSSYNDIDGMIDVMIACAKGDRCLLDPFAQAIREYFVVAFTRSLIGGATERKKGRLQHLIRLIDNENRWEEEKIRIDVVNVLARLLKSKP